jgi:hypothetical protein
MRLWKRYEWASLEVAATAGVVAVVGVVYVVSRIADWIGGR